MYSHEFLNDDDYFKNVYVKTNIVDQLEKELSDSSWKREVINIGGVTDSYQLAEARYKLMPEILKLLIKYKTPAIISTKSDLILRDYELIDQLSRITYVNVATTITTTDEELRKQIEPEGCETQKRFEMIKTFRRTNASTGLHVMPIIPFLTDSYVNIESICIKGREANVHYMLTGALYLRGKTRNVFFDFIENKYPHLYDDFRIEYKSGGASKEYKDNLYKMVNKLRNEYGLSGCYTKSMKEKMHAKN
jgi:DNA repair photolyase